MQNRCLQNKGFDECENDESLNPVEHLWVIMVQIFQVAWSLRVAMKLSWLLVVGQHFTVVFPSTEEVY